MPRRSQRLAAVDRRTPDEGSSFSRATNEGASRGGLPSARNLSMRRNRRGTQSSVLNRAQSTERGNSRSNRNAGMVSNRQPQPAANITSSLSSFAREYFPGSAQKILQVCGLAVSMLLYPRFFKFLISPSVVASATVTPRSLVPRSLWSLRSLPIAVVLGLVIYVAVAHLGASKCPLPEDNNNNIPIQRKRFSAISTLQEDARRCHKKLKIAYKENVQLKNQIRPLQDELVNLQGKMQNIVKTTHDVDGGVVKDAMKHHVPSEASTLEDSSDVDNSNTEEDNTIVGTGDTAVGHSSHIPQQSFLSDHSTYPDVIIQLNDQMSVGFSEAARPIRAILQKIPRANVTTVSSPQYY